MFVIVGNDNKAWAGYGWSHALSSLVQFHRREDANCVARQCELNGRGISIQEWTIRECDRIVCEEWQSHMRDPLNMEKMIMKILERIRAL